MEWWRNVVPPEDVEAGNMLLVNPNLVYTWHRIPIHGGIRVWGDSVVDICHPYDKCRESSRSLLSSRPYTSITKYQLWSIEWLYVVCDCSDINPNSDFIVTYAHYSPYVRIDTLGYHSQVMSDIIDMNSYHGTINGSRSLCTKI